MRGGGYDELEEFRSLDARIGLGLGVVDIKDNGIETACGLWMLTRAVAGRDLFEGRRS